MRKESFASTVDRIQTRRSAETAAPPRSPVARAAESEARQRYEKAWEAYSQELGRIATTGAVDNAYEDIAKNLKIVGEIINMG